MIGQRKWLTLAALGASAAGIVPAHVQVTAGDSSGLFDASRNESSEPKPIGSPSRWFGSDSYPPEAMRANEEGTVTFAVDVDAEGRPASCRIVRSSNSPSLDAETCAIVMEHGEFTPAHDAAGKAIAGTWENTTTWKLSEGSVSDKRVDLASGPLRWSATTQYTLDEHGIAVDCLSISREGGIVDPCLQFVPGDSMGPALTRNGVPVRGKLTLTVSSRIEPLPPRE